MQRPAIRFFAPVFVTVAIATVVWVNAGQLDPPAGAINPTGPTTINGQDVNNALPYTISSPGSYILTSNIEAPAGYTGHGIVISANNVTLDLNGFALIGVVGSGDGIDMPFARANVVIRNGNIRDWDGDGIDARIVSGRIERISASSNGGWGISNASSTTTHIISCEGLGNGNVVANTGGIRGDISSKMVDCVSRGNTGDGIRVDAGSTITGCTAYNNGIDGISAARGSTITGCTARSNIGDGIDAGDGSTISGCTAYFNSGDGIRAGGYSTIAGCTARQNSDGIDAGDGSTISGCTASFNNDDGIDADQGSTISGCTARSNRGDGIQVNLDCYVVGNNCNSNGFGVPDGAGIHVTGADNRIEGNNVTDNDRGIDVDDDGNLIIRNSASSNTTNYDIVANNKVGVIVAAPNSGAISGSTGGAGVGSTDPWANFSF